MGWYTVYMMINFSRSCPKNKLKMPIRSYPKYLVHFVKKGHGISMYTTCKIKKKKHDVKITIMSQFMTSRI